MKILFVSILASLFVTNSFGQKSIVKFQIGYGLPLTLTKSLAYQNMQVNSSTTTSTAVNGSYGSGLRLEAGYIHALSEHLFLEMDFTYLIGKSFNSTYNPGNGSIQNFSSSSRFYEFSPLLRVNLGGSKIKPYASIGPVIGLGTIKDANTESAAGTNLSEIQREYSGSVAIGAKSAVGAELTQGKFVFYAQLTLIAMSYSPDKLEYTKFTVNGTDQLPFLTIWQKQTVYKNSVTTANNGSIDPTKPNEQLKIFHSLQQYQLECWCHV